MSNGTTRAYGGGRCAGRGDAAAAPLRIGLYADQACRLRPEDYGMMCDMEKFFNTAGPCIPAEHYMLPALDRLPEIRRLVALRRYFVIHAPNRGGGFPSSGHDLSVGSIANGMGVGQAYFAR